MRRLSRLEIRAANSLRGGGGSSNPAPDNRVQHENNFPRDLVRLGVGVGILFVVVGIVLLLFDGDRTVSALTICVGFGLVLAAFGSKAGGAWAGWSATGAGAMAIILFLLLIQIGPPPTIDIVRGRLEGDFSKVADLRIIDEDPLYVYRDRATSTVKFLMLEKKLRSSRLRIQVDTTESGEANQYFQLLGDAAAIQKAYLSMHRPEGNFIQWTFDYGKRRVMDGTNVVFSEMGTIMDVADRKAGETGQPSWWSSAAFAQDDPSPNSFDEQMARAWLMALTNDDTYIRRNARDGLAAMGPDAVPLMMDELRMNFLNYRTRLGITYALGEMLRYHPSWAKQISGGIEETDFPLLAAAAADEDKTIRFQAAEFLYLLQDPRSIASTVDAAKNADQEEVLQNQILILRNAGAALPQSEKDTIKEDIFTNSKGIGGGKAPDVEKILKW